MRDIKHIVDNTLVPHAGFEKAAAKLKQCYDYADGTAEPFCLFIRGESRTGKSRSLEECYLQHLPTRTPDGLIVPILRIRTPSKPTVPGIVEVMLRAMGEPKFYRGTENHKIERLTKLMTTAKTRMLMVDEFQHFYDKGTRRVWSHVADWLKIMVDERKVALVVAGLPSAMAVFGDNGQQLVGRFMAPITMSRFRWKNSDDQEEFCAILGAFHEALSGHFDIPALDNEEMAFRCYCATGGLIGYLTKLLHVAVCNALDAKRKVITIKHLAQAYEDAIGSEEQSSEVSNPFSRSFTTAPTEDLLTKVACIGTNTEEAPVERKRRSVSVRLPTLRQALLGG
jgi:hypothetical protein